MLFQSTPSVWRETNPSPCLVAQCPISIHSLRVEGDIRSPCSMSKSNAKFQSTPSVWRETVRFSPSYISNVFQSTPSVWRETVFSSNQKNDFFISIHSLRVEGDVGRRIRRCKRRISIHSLRVEGDSGRRRQPPPAAYFNPLPPCGGRLKSKVAKRRTCIFQSTPSVWRETVFPVGSQ